MASKEEVFEKVRDIVATELEVDKEQVVWVRGISRIWAQIP